MNQTFADAGTLERGHGVPDHLVSTITHPSELVEHPGMGVAEKRAVLASWASDARALEGAPALRQLDSGAIVRIDDILAALRALDERDAADRGAARVIRFPFDRRRGRMAARRRAKPTRFGQRDDDDDPPPCPAAMAWPVRPSFVTAYGCR